MAYKSQCADEDDSKTNDMDIPPTHIMQISGHRNVQSINNYGHVSQQQQKNMSLILSSTSTAAEAAANAPRTSVMTESESKTETLSLIVDILTWQWIPLIYHQFQSQQQETALNALSEF